MHVSTSAPNAPVDLSIPLEARRPSVSISRRWLAFLVDMVLTMALGSAAIAAGSVFVPIDQAGSMSPLIYAGFIVGISHLAWSPALFGNTLGKLVFGLHIAARDGGQPRAVQLLGRGLVLVLLMPINALLVVYRGRHLGDQLANVEVVRGERSLLLALPLALGVFVLSFYSMFPLLRLAVSGASVTQVARKAAGANGDLPLAFTLQDGSAEFYLASDQGPRRVVLRRQKGAWEVVSVNAVAPDDVPSQVSIRAGVEETKKARIEEQIRNAMREKHGVTTTFVRCPEEGLVGTVQCRAGTPEGHEVSFPVVIKDDGLQIPEDAIFLGKAAEPALAEAIRQQYGRAPDRVACPALFEATQPLRCTASFADQRAAVTIDYDAREERLHDLRSNALFTGKELEARAREAWPATNARVMMPVCLERSYLIADGQEATCETTLDDTVVVFRNGPKGLEVTFKTR